MNTRASQNGTNAATMEFEATHPYNVPEMEEEWEQSGASHYTHPYNVGEMEEEWEHAGATSHYSHPYNVGEMEEEWEHAGTTSHYGPSSYNVGEMEEEWEQGGASHYNHQVSAQEWEDEADNFIPLLLKGAKMLLPHAKRLAMRVGRNLLNRSRQPAQQSISRPSSVGRDQQIAALFRQLGSVFAQGESEAAAHEAELFGGNEFETEVAGHAMAHQAALAEIMAAEATHTESESEAQALLAASVPLMINVVRGGLAIRRLTPRLVQLNARLVLSLHRQGRPGRQLLAAVPAIQHRTLTTLKAIQRTGQPITPRLAQQVMAGQTMRVLGNPRICGPALVRNAIIRRQTVAPSRVSSLRSRNA